MCGPQLTKRQKPQAPSWGRAFGANPSGWSSLAWAHGKQCCRQCCVTASSCSPTKLAARHPSLLYQATLIFFPQFSLSHSAQSLQSKNLSFFLNLCSWWEMRQCLDLQMPKDLVIWSSSSLICQMGLAHFICLFSISLSVREGKYQDEILWSVLCMKRFRKISGIEMLPFFQS